MRTLDEKLHRDKNWFPLIADYTTERLNFVSLVTTDVTYNFSYGHLPQKTSTKIMETTLGPFNFVEAKFLRQKHRDTHRLSPKRFTQKKC